MKYNFIEPKKYHAQPRNKGLNVCLVIRDN